MLKSAITVLQVGCRAVQLLQAPLVDLCVSSGASEALVPPGKTRGKKFFTEKNFHKKKRHNGADRGSITVRKVSLTVRHNGAHRYGAFSKSWGALRLFLKQKHQKKNTIKKYTNKVYFYTIF